MALVAIRSSSLDSYRHYSYALWQKIMTMEAFPVLLL